MKIRIEVDPALAEPEVVIHCPQVDDEVQKLQQAILQQDRQTQKLVFYQDAEEYYFPVEQVLFFETEGEPVYAHTENDAYRVRQRLYELEQLLPQAFVRISKSTIVNTRKIYSIRQGVVSSNQIQFAGTHKQVYVSRRYLAALRKQMGG